MVGDRRICAICALCPLCRDSTAFSKFPDSLTDFFWRVSKERKTFVLTPLQLEDLSHLSCHFRVLDDRPTHADQEPDNTATAVKAGFFYYLRSGHLQRETSFPCGISLIACFTIRLAFDIYCP